MTSAQQTQLDALWDAYIAAKNVYNIEVADNVKAHSGTSNIDPGASDRSLAAKKRLMESAYTDWDLFNKTVIAADKAAFDNLHPEIKAAGDKALVQQQTDIEKARIAAQADLQKANYASGNTKYFIIGFFVVVIIIAGVIIYRRRKGKSAPAAA